MSQENRIDQRFAALKEEGKAAFVAYICAGDPNMDRSLEIMHGLERAGADIIELGIPFSDPMADGIVNQMAAHRALEAGGNTRGVLDLVRHFRESSEVPIVLFTYLNPVYTYGFEAFHRDAAEAGADGVLLLDLPPDEVSHEELQELDSLAYSMIAPPRRRPHSKTRGQQASYTMCLARASQVPSKAWPRELPRMWPQFKSMLPCLSSLVSESPRLSNLPKSHVPPKVL